MTTDDDLPLAQAATSTFARLGNFTLTVEERKILAGEIRKRAGGPGK